VLKPLVALLALMFVWIALPVAAGQEGSCAVIYYWKAKEGKLEEYNRYIREVAEPIDAEARRQAAFISVTTFVSSQKSSPWTHMRVFILKDRGQAEKLSSVLDAAGIRLEPDEGKRKARSAYAATLRDFVAQDTVEILK
jgi:hypothetical protein